MGLADEMIFGLPCALVQLALHQGLIGMSQAQDKNQLKSLIMATSYCFRLRCKFCHNGLP